MFLLDVSHTAHSRALTGVQRVVRRLAAELQESHSASPVVWDAYALAWRPLEGREQDQLTPAATTPLPRKRGSRWSLSQKLRGYVYRLSRPPGLPSHEGIFLPEIPTRRVLEGLSKLPTHTSPVGALLHDVLPVEHPEWFPASTMEHFPTYLRVLRRLDALAAVSEASATGLLRFWEADTRDPDAPEPPPITVIPLAADAPSAKARADTSSQKNGDPEVLCVSTLEPRKNHIALLQAAEKLWHEGLRFNLHLAGALPRHAPTETLQLLERLSRERPLIHHGPVSETQLEALYASARFTVYPSLAEGFGLPLLESLRRSKPVICGPGKALAEVAPGGGVQLLPDVSAKDLANGMRQLLTNEARRTQLTEEARHRPYREWADVARDLTLWFHSIEPR